MAQLQTWWRKLGVACLLMALVVGPALEAFLCKGETDIAASSVLLINGQSDVSAAHDETAPDHATADICVHGHCHHGSVLGLPVATTLAATTTLSQSHSLSPSALPTSRGPSELDRPPRS